MPLVIYNHNIFEEAHPIIAEAEKQYQSNFGLIESILLENNQMPLWALHLERMTEGLRLLGREIPSQFINKIEGEIFELAQQNKLSKSKIRLRIFYYNQQLHYLLQTQALPESSEELKVGVAKGLQIQPTEFSCLKSNKRGHYNQASRQAAERGLDDLILLNTNGCITESTIANVFCQKDGILITPPLSEGLVAGVYRKALLQGNMQYQQFKVIEKPLSLQDLKASENVFLSNAVRGLRRVSYLDLET